MNRSFSVLSIAAVLAIGHPALAQTLAPLPCNALCRAYLGSHYTPPGEIAAEPSETAAVFEPEEGPTVAPQPPRRPVRAGLPPSRRFAVLPPPRPDVGTERRDLGPATNVLAIPLAPPLDPPAAMPPVVPPAAMSPAAMSPIEPAQNAIAPEPVVPPLDPVGAAPEAASDAAPTTTEPPPAAFVEPVSTPAETTPVLAVPPVVAVPASPVAAAVPEPRQRSLLE